MTKSPLERSWHQQTMPSRAVVFKPQSVEQPRSMAKFLSDIRYSATLEKSLGCQALLQPPPPPRPRVTLSPERAAANMKAACGYWSGKAWLSHALPPWVFYPTPGFPFGYHNLSSAIHAWTSHISRAVCTRFETCTLLRWQPVKSRCLGVGGTLTWPLFCPDGWEPLP